MGLFPHSFFKLALIAALAAAPAASVGAEPEGDRTQEPAPPPLEKKEIIVWSLIGVSGAAVIAGGVFGLTALDEKERFEDNPALDFEDRKDARAVASYVSFSVAGAAAVAALIVWLEFDGEGESPPVAASISPSGVSLTLTF